MKFQTIEVSLMHNLYATISHLKYNHIVYIVFPVEKLNYPDDPVSPADSLIETKFIFNSNIFDKKESMIHAMWPQGFFLGLADGSIRVHVTNLKHHLPDIIQRYNLHGKKVARDGYFYIKIKKGMYGLKNK